MIKTLWYSLYVLLALSVMACGIALVGIIVAALFVSPWFLIGVPIAIVLPFVDAAAAGWAIDKGLNA